MAVLFNEIPGNLRVPFFRAEFQPGGTPFQSIARLLILGQKAAAGSVPANEPVSVRDGQAPQLVGFGSMLHQMDNIVRNIAPVQEVWYGPLDDAGAGVAAQGKITVNSAALPVTYPRSVAFYFAGRRYRILVATTDTEDDVATKVDATIMADSYRPADSTINGVNANEVDLTARWKGTTGNTARLEYGIEVNGDDPLAYSLFTFTQMTGGAGDPEIDTILGNLAGEEFDWICAPYSDGINVGHALDYLNDSSGAWSWLRQTYGHYLTVHYGDYATVQAFGLAQNSNHISTLPGYMFESPSWDYTAALGALAAKHLQSAPELSRPLQTLEMRGIKGPRKVSDRFGDAERQALYYDGISGVMHSRIGQVQLERVITMYRLNAWGDPDATYLDLNTMAQSMFGIRFLRQKITNTYPRVALAGDDAEPSPNVARPIDIRNTLIHGYEELCSPTYSVFENPGLFADSLVVERNGQDANRVDAYLPLDHVNQLRIMAVAAANFMQREAALLAA